VFTILGFALGSGWNRFFTRAVGCAALFALLKAYKGFRRPSYERAVELAEAANLPPGLRIVLDREYGVLDAEQARQALQALARPKDADRKGG
jgi:hypothetical protein